MKQYCEDCGNCMAKDGLPLARCKAAINPKWQMESRVTRNPGVSKHEFCSIVRDSDTCEDFVVPKETDNV